MRLVGAESVSFGVEWVADKEPLFEGVEGSWADKDIVIVEAMVGLRLLYFLVWEWRSWAGCMDCKLVGEGLNL